jgi:hypothetical protein
MIPRMLKHFWSWVRTDFDAAKPPRDPYHSTRIMLYRMIATCPICGKQLSGHAWGDLAEAKPTDASQLLELLRARDWKNLVQIQTFIATENAVIAIAIECTNNSGATFAYVDYADLWSGNDRGQYDLLNAADWQNLKQTAPAIKWHLF